MSGALASADRVRLQRLRRLPLAFTRTPRRRRLALVVAATPAAAAAAAAVSAHAPQLLAAAATLLAGLAVYRATSEPIFRRAEAASLWPPQHRRQSR